MKLRRLKHLLKLIEKSLWDEYKVNVYHTSMTLKGSSNLQKVTWYERTQGKTYYLCEIVFNWYAVRNDDVSELALQAVNWITFNMFDLNVLSLDHIETLFDVESGLYNTMKLSDKQYVDDMQPLYEDRLIANEPNDGVFPFDIVLTEDGKEALKHYRYSKFVEI